MKMILQRSLKTISFSQMQLVTLSIIKPISEVTYQKMLKDKKDDPDKKIPPKFGTFIKSQEYRELLESMLDYCRVITFFFISNRSYFA